MWVSDTVSLALALSKVGFIYLDRYSLLDYFIDIISLRLSYYLPNGNNDQTAHIRIYLYQRNIKLNRCFNSNHFGGIKV